MEFNSPELTLSLNMADMAISVSLFRGAAIATVTDTITGVDITITCSPLEIASIIFLAINGDEGPDKVISKLYKIAEKVVGEFPLNLRPIP